MVSHHHSRAPSFSDLPTPSVAGSAPPAPPRASSTISGGRSHTRRHRHARSHHGSGSSGSHTQQNEFPIFSHTGDVDIVISSADGRKENRYLLHKLILSQCSGFFEAGTRAEWSSQRAIDTAMAGGALPRINEVDSATAGSSSRASSQERRPAFAPGGQGVSRRWKYVLDWQNAGEDDTPMLVQRDNGPSSIFGDGDRAPPVRNNKPPPSNEGFFRSMTNFSALNLHERTQPSAPAEPGDEVLKDYDNLFRTMYQYPPVLDSINIATAYTECKALLHLADMYDALEIVGTRVDHHLLRFGARLFKQVAKYPPSYLKLGYLARSRTIFSEALIHVVGQWPLAQAQLRNQIDANVMELILDKVDDMDELQQRIEAKLWRLTLTTSRGDRVTPANDFLAWQATSLFRQWFAENTTPPPNGILKDSSSRPGSNSAPAPARASSRSSSTNHIASQRVPTTAQPAPSPQPQNTGRIYRTIGASSPSTYLGHDELKRFLKLQPDLYTRENLRRFEKKMDEVKNLAREAVRPLMRNFLELDLGTFGAERGGTGGLGYLTCTRLEDRELPWEE